MGRGKYLNYDTVSKGGEGGLLFFSANGEIPAEAEDGPLASNPLQDL